MALEVGNPQDSPSPPPDNTPTPDTTFDPSVVTIASAGPSVPTSASTSSIPSSLFSPTPLGGGGMQRPDNDPITMLKALMPTPEQIEKKRRMDESVELAKIHERENFEREEADYNSRYHAQAEKLLRAESYTGDEKPWDPQTMAPPPTNLWEKFASPGFIFAMLAGQFSAMPMNSALLGGAAAINAINNGDMDGYEKAYQAWKDNTALAIKRHDQEHREFEDIMKVWEKDNAHARDLLEEHLQKYGDYGKLAMLRAGYDQELFEATAGQYKAIGEVSKMQSDMEAQHALHVGVTKRMEAGMPADQAYNEALKDREEAKKPFEGRKLDLAEWKARMDDQHKNVADDVKRGRLTLDEAKAEEDRLHKENMDAIAAGRLDASITRETETERWHKAREALDAVKIEKADEKEKDRKAEADRKLSLAEWKAKADDENKKRVVAVQEGRLTVEQAKEEVEAKYKAVQADVLEGRLSKDINAEAWKEQYQKDLLALQERKVDVSKPMQEFEDRRVLTSQVIAEHSDWSPGQVTEEVRKRMAASAAAPKGGLTGKAALEKADKDEIEKDLREKHPDWSNAQIIEQRNKDYASSTKASSQTPEGIALEKFLEQNPNASAEKIQAFRQLGRALGRSPSTMAVAKFVSEHPEATSEDISRFGALFNRAQSFARTSGTRQANVDAAVIEVEKFAKAAKAASDNVPRSNWKYLNEYYEGGLRELSDPAMQVLDNATTSLATAYAQTMSRSGGNTVAAMERADKILQAAAGAGAYKAGVDFLIFEAHLVQRATEEAFTKGAGGNQIKSIKKIGD